MVDLNPDPARKMNGHLTAVSSGSIAPEPPDACHFLEKLRPGGPWVLTACEPEREGIETVTTRQAAGVRRFNNKHNGKWGLYYSVNPTRKETNKKAAKVDIAAIEFALADLDPKSDETSEAAKERYLAELDTFAPAPTGIVDSGNGIQVLWRLAEPILLPDLTTVVKDEKGKDRKVYTPEVQAIIDDVEGRIGAVMVRLGSVAGTQNIDRILRLPGTINVPNAKKISEGRTPCLARLIKFDATATCSLSDFPPAPGGASNGDKSKSKANGKAKSEKTRERELPPELDWLIDNGAGGGNVSDAFHRAVRWMAKLGWTVDRIAWRIEAKPIVPERYVSQHRVLEEIERSLKKNSKPNHEGADAWRNNLMTAQSGEPKALLANAILALRGHALWAGVLVFNEFTQETIVAGAPPWCPGIKWEPRPWTEHEDLLTTDWLQQQGLGVNSKVTAQAVEVVAREKSFHPVIDYLDSLKHDGVERLGTWLTTYLGAESSDYNKAVGKAMTIAAVARVRQPGCKADNIPILEGPQGAFKSTGVKMLFGSQWFTDELADLGSKDAAMQTCGVWCIEVSELDAMSRAEVSKIKSFISRTQDRFRPPYGMRLVDRERSCVFWAGQSGEADRDKSLKF
jgi:hypothetical protein